MTISRSFSETLNLIVVLPLIVILVYLISTILFYLWGPMSWPATNRPILLVFLSCFLFGIPCFYLIGARVEVHGSSMAVWKRIVISAAALGAIALFPSAYYFAGKMPWQILEALRDQGRTYAEFQANVQKAESGRALASILRAGIYPLGFAAVPLGILHWRSMNVRLWSAWALVVFSFIALSILRGTDREVLEILFSVAAAAMLLSAREFASERLHLRDFANVKTMVLAGAAIILMVVVVKAFVDRRVQRVEASPGTLALKTGEANDIFCMRVTCTNKQHILIEGMPFAAKLGWSMLDVYLTSGYQGLSLALSDTNHGWTRGIGHSQAFTRLYERATGDTELYQHSITFRQNAKDWSDGAEWSTIFPWLANDVGWIGALCVMFAISAVFAICWRDAIFANDDRAAIVFCFLFLLFIYVPANNQIAQSMDTYLAFLIWLGLWLINRTRVSRQTQTSGQ